MPFFVGAGAYRHHVPASVDHLIQRSEFLTTYTPYQPEIAQGTLQMLFEFQTQVALLTGMEVANASMYDGSTGCGRGGADGPPRHAARARRCSPAACIRITRDVVAHAVGDGRRRRRVAAARSCGAARTLLAQIDDRRACVVVQTPDVFGNLRDLAPIAEACHAKGALLIAVVTEVVSLGAHRSRPARWAPTSSSAKASRSAIALNFGGPYVGLFATREKYVRQMPGRLCGETVDADGKRGFVLTLSTREQHIRREKATSQHLHQFGPLRAGLHDPHDAAGRDGPARARARSTTPSAVQLADALGAVPGVEVLNDALLQRVHHAPAGRRRGGGRDAGREAASSAACRSRACCRHAGVDDLLIVAGTEINTDEDRAALVAALSKEVLHDA